MAKRKGERTVRVIALIASLALAFGLIPAPAFAAGAQALTAGAPAQEQQAAGASTALATQDAGDQQVTTEESADGKYYTKIKVGPWTYTDVAGGAKQKLDDAAVLNVVKNNLIEPWATIAMGCFAGAGDCASIDNYRFEEVFMTDSPKYDCFGNVQKVLAGKTDNKGEAGDDNLWGTGVRVASSLSEVREAMAEQIAAQIGNSKIKAAAVLDQGPPEEDSMGSLTGSALKEMEEATQNQKVVYSIATSFNDLGTNKSKYNSFGICFYDFEPRAIQADGLQYKHASEGYGSVEEAAKNNVSGVVFDSKASPAEGVASINESSAPGNQNFQITNTTSATVTNNTSHASTFTFGQSTSIGTTWGMSETVGTEVAKATYSASMTETLSFNFSEMYQETEQTSKSRTDTKTKTVSINTTLPPQAAAMVSTAESNTTFSEDYETPVMLSYKVAIFSMTGTILPLLYNSKGKYMTPPYSGCYLNIIGGDSSTGVSANENLRLRVVDNQTTGRNDAYSGGTVHRSFIRASEDAYDTLNVGTDWHNGLFASSKQMKEALDWATGNIPMMSCGCSYDTICNTQTATIAEPQPLYLPTQFKLEGGQKDFKITAGDTLNLSKQLDVTCLNRNDVPYYGFKESDGGWVVCDENRAPVDSSCISITTNGGDQIVTAESAGEAHVMWKPNDLMEYTSVKDTGSVTSQTQGIEWPLVKIVVQDAPFDGSVEVSGEFTGCVGDEGANLNDYLKVMVKDKTGKQVRVPFAWDQQELDGITVSENGDIAMTEPGDYHVRAMVKNTAAGADDVCSEWFPISVGAKRVLSKVELDQSAIDGEAMTLSKSADETHVVDLMSFVKGYDQYGQPWTGDLGDVSFELDSAGGNIAHLEGDYLHITGTGTFGVQPVLANSYAVGDDLPSPIKFSVASKPGTITVEYVDATGASMGTQECIDISTLSNEEINKLGPGWYAVQGTVSSGINAVASGDVNLILCDGAVWEPYELMVYDGNLTIWGQAAGTGKLHVPSSYALWVFMGSATMNGGILESGYGAPVQVSSAATFTMNGGEVIGHENGGAGVENYGTLVMNAGTITAPSFAVECLGPFDDPNNVVKANGGTLVGGTLAVRGPVENSVAGLGWNEADDTGPGTLIKASSEPHNYLYAKMQFPAYAVNAAVNTAEGGTVTGDGAYASDDRIVMSAVPGDGYYFVNWTEDGNLVSPYAFFIAKAGRDRSLTANFEPRIGIDGAKVVLSKTKYTYNNKVHKPKITSVTVGGETLVEDVDYTAKWSKASSKKVGTYKVTLTGEGKYTGTVSATYKIVKAKNTLAAKGKTANVNLAKLAKKAQTIKRSKAISVSNARGNVTYTLTKAKKGKKNVKSKFKIAKKGGKITVKKGTPKGTYKLTVKVRAAGTKSYKALTKPVTVTVKVK